jgi:MFS transporter, SP family, sugar:H+ symporter
VEELDTMYLLRVNPRKSSKWIAPPKEELVTTEKLVRGESGPAGADVERNGSTVTPETAPSPSAAHVE